MIAMAPPPFQSLAAGRWGLIAADPPWHFRARTMLTKTNRVSRRDAEKHYTVMGIEDIKALPVRSLAAKDAHLFLWTTGPMLPKAFEVMTAWGFKYSAVAFTWVKLKRSFDFEVFTLLPPFFFLSDLHVGLGLTTRKNSEVCLLGRRGNARRSSKSVHEIIVAPRREHSRKPDEAYERMQEYATGPYLELFARTVRPSWAQWGHEVGKFSAYREAAE